MSLLIHDDRFLLELSYNRQALPFHKALGVADEDECDDPDADRCLDFFSGPRNKVQVLPENIRPINIKFELQRGFGFLSGDAISVRLRIVTAAGELPGRSQKISKQSYVDLEPDESLHFVWRVFLNKSPEGTVFLTLTQGKGHTSRTKFIPLDGEDGTPYTMEIDWRVLDTALHSNDPEDDVSLQTEPTKPAAEATKITAEEGSTSLSDAAGTSAIPRTSTENIDATPGQDP